ncbi:RodZ domain-containing protein [Marinobacterium rhizophilum]|uniref:DUF4115 domain-containing protein n=1 Tax=Marinobacterium rhizophilum TaxID=420402 RepID=A0ABY5HJP0_9GAMM|nr:RodZ domain-containing protein [Marinobacterium rhizophilum]UTW11793.1 DUF4115 domain-containing protein [Marinobacterium rhizophilum]
MNQVSQAESESSAASSQQFSLTQLRERQGLSQEQVASSLRLPLAQVRALEEGDYDKLPSCVFARGYLRSYARLLGVSGDDLVGEFDRSYGAGQASASIRSISRVQPAGSSGTGVSLSMLLLVAVIVATTFWWWKTQYGNEVALTHLPESTVAVDTANGETLVLSAGEPESTAVEVPDRLESVDSTPVAAVDIAIDSVVASAAVVALPVAEVDAAVSPEVPVLEAVSGQAAAEVEDVPVPVETSALAATGLVVRFQDDCWVTVKGPAGKTLFNNMRKAGDELRLDEAGPVSVLLGRASAVSEITFGGTAVDLAPFSNKNVARLTLPLN